MVFGTFRFLLLLLVSRFHEAVIDVRSHLRDEKVSRELRDVTHRQMQSLTHTRSPIFCLPSLCGPSDKVFALFDARLQFRYRLLHHLLLVWRQFSETQILLQTVFLSIVSKVISWRRTRNRRAEIKTQWQLSCISTILCLLPHEASHMPVHVHVRAIN